MLSIIKDRPLVFFDLETTGTNLSIDRIVELSIVKLFPNGEREVKTRRLNPEMHIPEESAAIHGIHDEDVKDCPTFRNVSKNLFIYLEDCDLAGYNIIKFDIPMLTKEFSQAGLHFSLEKRRVIDAFYLYCRMEPRSLSATYRLFCGKKLEDAHSAEADTLATVAVFEAELEKYSRMPEADQPEGIKFAADLDVIHDLCNPKIPDAIDPEGKFRWKENEPCVAFGRNSGVPLRKLATDNPDFFKWILRSDFSPAVKEIASNALKGVFPVKPK